MIDGMLYNATLILCAAALNPNQSGRINYGYEYATVRRL